MSFKYYQIRSGSAEVNNPVDISGGGIPDETDAFY